MGTTKLTRKEILAEDSVHESIVFLVDYFRSNTKLIFVSVAVILLLSFGVYGGLKFLKKQKGLAQEKLAAGIDLYHAGIDPKATEDFSGKGSTATFKNESLKYQAAAEDFASVINDYGYTGAADIAQYYLGLCQFKLGKNEDAVHNLEDVVDNNRGETIGYLANKVLVSNYIKSGDYETAEKILESMIADKKMNLPKEDLSIQLSKVLMKEGKKEEAVKVLQEATTQGSSFGALKQRLISELEMVQNTIQAESKP